MTTRTSIPKRAAAYLASHGTATATEIADALDITVESASNALNRRRDLFAGHGGGRGRGNARTWRLATSAGSKPKPAHQQPSAGRRPAEIQQIAVNPQKHDPAYFKVKEGAPTPYVEPVSRFVKVAPGEKTCTGCGETFTGWRCYRCGCADGVETVEYLREGEWRVDA